MGGAALVWSAGVWAHDPMTGTGQEQLAGVFGVVLLLLFWGGYLRGSLRRQPPRDRSFLFHAGALICALALFGPLDDWAKTSTAAHMVQHMLLMVVVAPLWVLSCPLPQLAIGAGRLFATPWNALLPLVRRPMTTAYLHAAAIWFWHTPYFYMVAVENPWWHALEHACFLVTAGLFWWAVLKSSAGRAPWAFLAVLFTLMHTGFLGAILTFAGAPMYGEARGLDDQQLAGLIMWVVGGVPYLLASGWIAHRFYRQLQRRMDAAG
jgi:putative membrane protein